MIHQPCDSSGECVALLHLESATLLYTPFKPLPTTLTVSVLGLGFPSKTLVQLSVVNWFKMLHRYYKLIAKNMLRSEGCEGLKVAQVFPNSASMGS